MKKIIRNIRNSYKHIPYTLKHRKKLIELSEIYLGKKHYYLHDLDKVVMYILIPWIGTKAIHKIHATLMNKYPDLLPEFEDTFHELGLGGQLENYLWHLNS